MSGGVQRYMYPDVSVQVLTSLCTSRSVQKYLEVSSGHLKTHLWTYSDYGSTSSGQLVKQLLIG